jgi:phosphomannomutase
VQAHEADALVTADGDGDRPLVVDERGTVVRGDVLGILVAAYLKADTVAAPVSCNTALERSGWFRHVTRTRIGSPYVIAGMQAALEVGGRRVVGFEANGGFLLGSNVSGEVPGSTLTALPTRDAALPILAGLHAAARRALGLSQLVASLPRRFTCSGLLRPFPTEQGRAWVARFEQGGVPEVERCFHATFGPVKRLDFTDGARVTFADDVTVHVRPSGNAPEFRVYTEAESEERAAACLEQALALVRQSAAPAAS